MDFFSFVTLAADAAPTLPPAPASGGTEWTTIIYSTITALVTLASSFWFSRKKQRTDDFAAFMEESADFREEIRKELERKKVEYEKEVEHYKKLVADQMSVTDALRKENQDYITNYKYLIDFMYPLVFTADTTGKVNFFNLRWYEYTGLSFEQAKDSGWMTAIHMDDKAATEKMWAIAIQRNMAFEARARIQRSSDGGYRWFVIKGTPRYDGQGRVVQWILTCTDINELMVERFKKEDEEAHETPVS